MLNKRRILMAGATFLLAAATGHVMQNGEALVASLGDSAAPEPSVAAIKDIALTSAKADQGLIPADEAPMAVAALGAATTAPMPAPAPTAPRVISVSKRDLPALPGLPSVEPTPLAPGLMLAARMEKVEDGYTRVTSDADRTYNAFGTACADPVMTLGAAEHAMIDVRISAGCHPNERVLIKHSDLAFAVVADDRGEIHLQIPAFEAKARVSVRFSSGDVISAVQPIADLDRVARTGIYWRGSSAFHLAGLADAPELTEKPALPAAVPAPGLTRRPDGFVTVLGSAAAGSPVMAEIFTLPVGSAETEIQLEAEITKLRCGRDLQGETLTTVTGKKPLKATLSIAMPECDAVGDLIVMSLLPELRRLDTTAMASAR